MKIIYLYLRYKNSSRNYPTTVLLGRYNQPETKKKETVQHGELFGLYNCYNILEGNYARTVVTKFI